MEKTEIFLYFFLVSHYMFTVFVIWWIFVHGTPTPLTNYGLPYESWAT